MLFYSLKRNLITLSFVCLFTSSGFSSCLRLFSFSLHNCGATTTPLIHHNSPSRQAATRHVAEYKSFQPLKHRAKRLLPPNIKVLITHSNHFLGGFTLGINYKTFTNNDHNQTIHYLTIPSSDATASIWVAQPDIPDIHVRVMSSYQSWEAEDFYPNKNDYDLWNLNRSSITLALQLSGSVLNPKIILDTKYQLLGNKTIHTLPVAFFNIYNFVHNLDQALFHDTLGIILFNFFASYIAEWTLDALLYTVKGVYYFSKYIYRQIYNNFLAQSDLLPSAATALTSSLDSVVTTNISEVLMQPSLIDAEQIPSLANVENDALPASQHLSSPPPNLSPNSFAENSFATPPFVINDSLTPSVEQPQADSHIASQNKSIVPNDDGNLALNNDLTKTNQSVGPLKQFLQASPQRIFNNVAASVTSFERNALPFVANFIYRFALSSIIEKSVHNTTLDFFLW